MTLETLLSARTQEIKPSAIRQIFALANRPGVISFAGGWPDPTLFPVEELRQISDQVLREESAHALQYGPTAGHPGLLEFIHGRMHATYDLTASAEQMMITSGSMQGIYLTMSLLVNPGDTVITEAPTFVGAFGSMQTFQANIQGIPLDENGLDTDALEAYLQTDDQVKVVYAIPEFQNPSGTSMSLGRRQHLVQLAEQYDFMILEDLPYSDLRYEGEPLPPIYTLDPHGRTIYLGSFSKILSPMRVGWMVAPAMFIQKAIASKQAIDVCTPMLTQSIIAHFCQQGHLEEQIALLCEKYGAKRNTMLGALDRSMPAGVEWTSPEGGMFIWLTLPDHLNATDLFHKAIEQDVAFVVGSAFYPASFDIPQNTLRLNFITPSSENITTGITRLGQTITQML